MTPDINDINPITGLLNSSFGIGTYQDKDKTFPGLVRSDGSTIDLSDKFYDTHAIFDDWERNFDLLVDINEHSSAQYDFDTLQPLPPLSHPNMLCAGANCKQHVAEMLTKNKFNQHNRLPDETDEEFFNRNYETVSRRKEEGIPFFWTGLHSSLAGANDDFVMPYLGKHHDWELELGIVLAKTQRFATREEAKELIAGYVMVNDMGSVDQFRRTDTPFKIDWISKHQPTCKLAGPFIVPAAFIPDTKDMRINLKVNGKVMQDWTVNDMIFDFPDLLAYASERIKLLPGDLMIGGSPPGNGAHHGRFLQGGDIMESEITFLGRQRNNCRHEDIGERTPTFGYWPQED